MIPLSRDQAREFVEDLAKITRFSKIEFDILPNV